MRPRCWKTKGTDTHSEYVILLLFNFNNGQNEHGSMLIHTHTACIVFIAFKQRVSSPVFLLTMLQGAQVWGYGSSLVGTTDIINKKQSRLLLGPSLPDTQAQSGVEGNICQLKCGKAAGM